MAHAARPRTRLPMVVMALVVLLAVALAAWLIFSLSPKTVEDSPAIAVPPSAAPAPMPAPAPATPPAT